MNNNLFNNFWDGLQKEIDTETEKQKKTFLDSIKEEFFLSIKYLMIKLIV